MYINDNGNIAEYKVIIDYKKLKLIRKQIIDNCSVIVKRKENHAQGFEEQDFNENIRNIKRGNLVRVNSPKSDSADINIYEYTYDKYIFPDIINIIDEIQKGNEQKIQFLFSTNDLQNDINKYRDIESLEKVVELVEEYIKIADDNLLKKIKSLIMDYESVSVYNPKNSIKDYYLELQNCFVFEKQRMITTDDIVKLKNLFGDDYLGKLGMILNYDKNVDDRITNPYVKKMLFDIN